MSERYAPCDLREPEVIMLKPVAAVFVLLGVAALGRLDRDGLIARAAVAPQALGYEIRVEVTVVRVEPAADSAAAPRVPAGGAVCE